MNPKTPLLLTFREKGDTDSGAKPCLQRQRYLNLVSYIDDDLFSKFPVRLAVLFIILHVVGLSLSRPAHRTSLSLAPAFRAGHLIRVIIPGSTWRFINLHLPNSSYAELAQVQHADSQ